MPTDTSSYIIAGGIEGKSRLNILSRVLQPHVSELFMTLGIDKWTSFLDVGCGSGDVTAYVARHPAAITHVVGVDYDPIIVKLAQESIPSGSENGLEFHHQDVYSLSWTETFDVTYARFLLSHLTDPMLALHQIVGCVQPGGLVIIEDLEFSAHYSHPPNGAFERYIQLYTDTVRRRGGNPELGAQLPDMLRSAGLEDVSNDVIQPAFKDGEGKWMAWLTLDRIRDSILAAGFVSATELDQIASELHAFTMDADTRMSLPKITRAWGRKRHESEVT